MIDLTCPVSFDEIASELTQGPYKQVGWKDLTPEQQVLFQPGLKEFVVMGVCRCGDEKIVEAYLSARVADKLRDYVNGNLGRVVVWRSEPEFEVSLVSVFTEYREDGPDTNYILGKRGVAEKMQRVSFYALFTMVDQSILDWAKLEGTAEAVRQSHVMTDVEGTNQYVTYGVRS